MRFLPQIQGRRPADAQHEPHKLQASQVLTLPVTTNLSFQHSFNNEFRFSISWARVLPAGIGEVNQAGLDYYNALITELLAAEIGPQHSVTLGVVRPTDRPTH